MIFAYDKDKIYFACTYDSLYDKQYQCPTEENLPVFLSSIITARLSAAPAALYASIITFPKRRVEMQRRENDTKAACFGPMAYST